MKKPTNKEMKEIVIFKLANRGVSIESIGEIVLELQKPYNPELTLEECIHNVDRVLEKREVLHAALVGIDLDMLAEKGLLSYPLQQIVESDEGLFGIDEIIALSIVNIHGSIGLTTYGFVDKAKTGIVKELDSDGEKVNTFLDDIVGAIAAAASSRVAHRARDKEEEE